MLFFLIITGLKIHSRVNRPQIFEDDFTDQGSGGPSATYSYAKGVLTFDGQGEINNRGIYGGPWNDYSSLITSIVINEGITSIDNRLFIGFIHLKTISIPASLTDYIGNIVTLCEELESYIISDDNQNLAVDGGVLYSKDFTILISVPSKLSSTYTFKNSVTTIKGDAFQKNKMTTLNIPSTITSIGNYAFKDSNELKSLTISDSVTSLGIEVFSDCHALETVNLGNGITSLPTKTFNNCTKLTTVQLNNNLEIIEDYAFNECSSLASIKLPNGLTKIGKSSFYYCSSLESINLVSSLTSIGISAFSNCKLSSINIPSQITIIEESTFFCCPITSLTIPGTVQIVGSYAFGNCYLLESVTFEEGVKTIAENVFYNCSSLTKATISSTVSSIDKHSFNDCYSMTTFEVSESNQNYASFNYALYSKGFHEIIRCPNGFQIVCTIHEATTSIGDEAFYNCKYLKIVNLPDGLITIGNSAFENCISLIEITLPLELTSIGEKAFESCSGIETLYMPNNVKQIGIKCFYFSNLHYLKLSDQLTEIPEYAFYGNKLQSVIVPDNIEILRRNSLYNADCNQVVIGKTVTLIEDYAFHARNLYFTGTQQPEISSSFDIGDAFILVTPEYEGDTFAGAPVSKTLRFGNYFESQYWLIDTETGVFDYIGYGNMLDFDEPSSVLWYSVFDLIKKVNIIDPIGCIGMNSFNSCPNLETVTFNSKLKSIGPYAFFNCSKFSGDITLPEGVDTIRDSAFAGTNLEIVTFLGSMQPICTNPFTADGIKQPPLLKIHVPLEYDYKMFCGIRADGLETEDYTDNTPISLPFPTPSPWAEVIERFECPDGPHYFEAQLGHPFYGSASKDFFHVVSVVNRKIYFLLVLEDNQFIKPVGKSIIDFRGGIMNIVLPKIGGTTILLGDEDNSDKISFKGSGEVTIKHEKEKRSTFNINRLLINGTIKIYVPDYVETIYIDSIQYEVNSVFSVVKENAKSVNLVVKNVTSFYMSNGELSDVTVLDTISLYQTGSLKINNVNLEKAQLLFYMFDYGNESFNNPFIKGNFSNPPNSIKIMQNVTSDEENPEIDEYYRIASGMFDENKCEDWIQKIDFGESSFNEKACLNNDNETLLNQQNEQIAIKSIPKHKSKNGLSGGAIAGIVIGCIAGVGLIVGAVFLVLYLTKKTKIGNDTP